MVDVWDGPPREGTRGGLEQFKWDSVKNEAMRDRECYLGQSVRIGMQGKFGRFSTHDWWRKERGDKGRPTIAEEVANVKQFEEDLMQEALGLKPKKMLLAGRSSNNPNDKDGTIAHEEGCADPTSPPHLEEDKKKDVKIRKKERRKFSDETGESKKKKRRDRSHDRESKRPDDTGSDRQSIKRSGATRNRQVSPPHQEPTKQRRCKSKDQATRRM